MTRRQSSALGRSVAAIAVAMLVYEGLVLRFSAMHATNVHKVMLLHLDIPSADASLAMMRGTFSAVVWMTGGHLAWAAALGVAILAALPGRPARTALALAAAATAIMGYEAPVTVARLLLDLFFEGFHAADWFEVAPRALGAAWWNAEGLEPIRGGGRPVDDLLDGAATLAVGMARCLCVAGSLVLLADPWAAARARRAA